MKTARDIITKHYGCKTWEEVCRDFLSEISPTMVIECIQEAQRDAINVTCLQCLDDVKLHEEYLDDIYNSNFEPKEGIGTILTDGDGEPYACKVVTIDKHSILAVAEKLKKDLR